MAREFLLPLTVAAFSTALNPSPGLVIDLVLLLLLLHVLSSGWGNLAFGFRLRVDDAFQFGLHFLKIFSEAVCCCCQTEKQAPSNGNAKLRQTPWPIIVSGVPPEELVTVFMLFASSIFLTADETVTSSEDYARKEVEGGTRLPVVIISESKEWNVICV
uniref:Uncharacterized protein n=1 Tax=Anopheles atroparvus TaxID=41427 RepID=A0A182IKI7_ANOAO